MDLHPESQKVVDWLEANKTDRSQMTIDEIRKGGAERSVLLSGDDTYPFDGTRKEMFVPSPHVKDFDPFKSAASCRFSDMQNIFERETDGIPIYVYTPNSLVAKDPVIFVYNHGGGMVLGTRRSLDSACKNVSQSAGCIIVNVEYRLAPEHKFPASIDDATTVTEWVKKNKTLLGGSEQSKVGIGGDSAGGTISASVAHDVPIDFQVLIYPHVTKARDYSSSSFTKYKDGPLLTVPFMHWLEANFVPEGEEANPRLASILRPKFDHLPPALVIIAEHDALRDGCWMYVKKLQDNGVPVETVEFKGAIHAFYGQTLFCPTLCKEAYDKVSNFIKKIQASEEPCAK